MANPNIVNVATINGNMSFGAVPLEASIAQIVSHGADSKIFKINSLYISNVDGTNSADVTVRIYPAATNTGTPRNLVSTVAVAADSTLVLITKDTAIYLLETHSIYVFASAENDLEYICSWDEIS